MSVAPYKIKRVGIVSTLLPGLAPKVIEKTLRVTADRLAPAGATIIAERRVPHDEAALAAAIKELLGLGAELVIVFGASAIADRRDVIPAALEDVGGEIEHFGMPVDPGNLLLIGNAGGVPVLGAPGLRALAGGEWFRLGADAAAGGPQGDARRSDRHGRRRTVDGDRDPAAAAQTGGLRGQPQYRGRHSRGRTFHPDGRSQQIAGRTRRQAAGADRDRAGAGLEGVRA